MPDSYPYTVSNNKIPAIFSKIRSAAKPTKFTHEFLKQLGFPSSNDRAVLSILKGLGFLSADGSPTAYYDRLRDSTDWDFVLGERMRVLYEDIFKINTALYNESDSEIKGAIARVTGKEEASVARYTATFKTLAGLAKFGESPKTKTKADDSAKKEPQSDAPPRSPKESLIEFAHNIQIHLPATTDVAVYNAIFKSVRENLMDE